MEAADYIVVLVTTGSREEAEKIARTLVAERKAACVNILPGINSLFWWEGKIDSAQEKLLIAKSRASALPDIIDLVKKVHSYSVPEIIALPIIGGNPDYLKWVSDNVS